MLSFLATPPPKRTKITHISTLSLDNGRSSVTFSKSPSSSNGPQRFTHIFHLPPRAPGADPKDNSSVIPPFHAHPHEEEIFRVTSGTALFHLNQQRIPVSAGEEITVPRREYHKFTNASATEPVTLEAWYSPAKPEREERFFRNLYGYIYDAAGSGEGMMDGISVAQVCLFAWEADSPVCEPMVKLNMPKWIGIPLAYGMIWFLGVFVGKWMLGYQASYEEYYHKSSE